MPSQLVFPPIWKVINEECGVAHAYHTESVCKFADSLWMNSACRPVPTHRLVKSILFRAISIIPRVLPSYTMKQTAIILCHLMVINGVLTLHAALHARRVPSWAVKVHRAMHPDFAKLMSHPSVHVELIRVLPLIILGSPGFAAGAYMLWAGTALYAGKFMSTRASGAPGLPSRCLEHLRGVVLPSSKDYRSLRCKLFRARPLSLLCLLPVVLSPSVECALLVESIIIRAEVPSANGPPPTQSIRLSRGHRNRP